MTLVCCLNTCNPHSFNSNGMIVWQWAFKLSHYSLLSLSPLYALLARFSFEWRVKLKYFIQYPPFCKEFFYFEWKVKWKYLIHVCFFIPLFAKNSSLRTLWKPSRSLCFSSSLLVFLLCVHKSTQVIPQFCNAQLLFSACCRVHNYIANLFLGYRLDNNLIIYYIIYYIIYFDVCFLLPKFVWTRQLHAKNTKILTAEWKGGVRK